MSGGYSDQDWYEEDRWRHQNEMSQAQQGALPSDPMGYNSGYYPDPHRTPQQTTSGEYYGDQRLDHGQYHYDDHYGNNGQYYDQRQQRTPQASRGYPGASATSDADFAKMRQMYDEEY